MAVGSIEIDILANTQKLVKSMNRAEKTVGKSIRNMTQAAGALVGIFATGAFLSRINATAAGLDAIGKTSSKLGIAAEKLQGLHLAATEAGLSTKTFDMALQRATRRIAEAAKGTGEAVGALNELNLSAEELSSLTPDQMLNRVADSMSGLTSDSDRLRLAFKLFDSEGVSMVNMLANGSKGLDDVAKKADKFGLIIGTKYIKAIERSNDAWGISSQVMDTVWKGITVGLSVSLVQLVEDLNKGTQKIDIFSTSLNLTKQVIYAAGRGFEILTTSINAAVSGYTILYTWMKAANGVKTPAERTEAWKMHALAMDANTKATNDWINAIGGTSANAMALKKMLDTMYTGLDTDAVKAKITGINGDIANQGSLWREVGKAADAYYTKLNNNTTTATSLVSGMNNIISSGLTNSFRQAMDGATNFGDVFENMAKDVVAQLIHVLVVQKAVAAALSSMGINAESSSAGGGTVTVGGAMADGGIAKRGSSFLVGEYGPEIVSLPKGANVTPNGQTPAGGGAVNINVINNSNSQIDVRENNNGDIDVIVSALANQITRGTGNFSKALESRYNLKKG